MSVPRASYDPRRVLLLSCLTINIKHKRTLGVYAAGALFALAQWAFLDAAILTSSVQYIPCSELPILRSSITLHSSVVAWR